MVITEFQNVLKQLVFSNFPKNGFDKQKEMDMKKLSYFSIKNSWPVIHICDLLNIVHSMLKIFPTVNFKKKTASMAFK